MYDNEKYRREKFQPRIEFIKKHFAGCGDPRILDVGCGDGLFLEMAIGAFPRRRHWGVDADIDNEQLVVKTGLAERADIFCRDIYDARFFDEPEFFDVITCFDVLEHLHMPQAFFRHARTLLTPNGIVMLSFPNVQLGYRMRDIKRIGIPDTDKTHAYLATPDGWRQMVHDMGWRVLDSWYGEHLTHIKWLPKVATRICKALKIDHRKVPILDQFEQSYIMVIVPK